MSDEVRESISSLKSLLELRFLRVTRVEFREKRRCLQDRMGV